jgi:hypothetical protein
VLIALAPKFYCYLITGKISLVLSLGVKAIIIKDIDGQPSVNRKGMYIWMVF